MEAATALDHSRLPSVANATLPIRYEAARAALAECSDIDECKDWADKTAALASYAKQADDEALYKMAVRIRSRAIRRCGELLESYQSPGERTDQPTDAAGPRSQRHAAEMAGMSERQEKTARRVASVPEEEFDAAVESDAPPTVTALAEMGKKHIHTSRPDGFNESIHAMGALDRFAEKCEAHTPNLIANGLSKRERTESLQTAIRARLWLNHFVTRLEGEVQ